MHHRHTFARFARPAFALLTALALLFAAAPAVAQSGDAANTPLVQQARAGQFEKVLDRLNQGLQGQRSPAVTSLIDDLKRFKSNKAARLEAQRDAFEEAQADIKTNLEEDDIESAMMGAIEAKQVAPEPWKTLDQADANTRQAVERSEKAAKQAMGQEQWVEALSHYRLLDTLFEKRGKYREPLDRVRRHVRVLRLYAPEVLQDLQEAYADRQSDDDQQDGEDGEGEAEDESLIEDNPAGDIDFTRWEKRLRGVRPTMLRQTLRYAEREHISGEGYVPLMEGAVHGLEVLVNTEQLAETFPSLGKQKPVKRFRQHLEDVQARLDRDQDDLNYHETTSIIDGILAMNRQTIDVPTRVLVYEMTDGATSRLDDFSSVIWPEDLSQFNRSIEGDFTGVGIQISRRDGELIVVTPLPNTPAYQAGIRAGDVISEVDGEDASRWSLNRAVREITGPKGSVVTLGIERTGHKELLQFDIERAEIEIESVRGWRHKKDGTWDFWIDEAGGIGYIRMSQFIKQTSGELDKAVEKMQRQRSLNGLILDLRRNPGGLLSSAQEVADRFIEKGPIVSTVDAQGNRNKQHSASKRGTYDPFPVVVLINDASASASEIVAGALQAYDRALIVGSRSFGKGSVQDLFPLVRRKAYLKLTTQYYMLPDGRVIHRKPGDEKWGVEPDLELKMTFEQRSEAAEMRQDADIMRQPGVDGDDQAPGAADNDDAAKQGTDGEDANDGAAAGNANADDANQRKRVDPRKLLTEGVDPQLEAALLYLKTRLIADDVAIAQGAPQEAAK
jgi:carboxyl-terminal processing protease